MKNLFIILVISCAFSGCTTSRIYPSSIDTPTELVVSSQIPTLSQPVLNDTLVPDLETTPENPYVFNLTNIENPMYRFSWDREDDTLYYTSNRDLDKWITYPEGRSNLNLQIVYPVLSEEVARIIGFYNLSDPPKYSISPSGNQVLFWKKANINPTTSPLDVESPHNQSEYFQDVFRSSAGGLDQEFVASFEGEIIDAYWSNDEKFVYLLFDHIQIPSDNVIIEINLSTGSFKDIVPSGIDCCKPWIAISPDDRWVVFQPDGLSSQVMLLDRLSGEITLISELPPFIGLYWLKNNNWLLVSNTNEGSRFLIYDYILDQEISSMEFTTRVQNYIGPQRPLLSSSKEYFAFTGVYSQEYETLTLHILSIKRK